MCVCQFAGIIWTHIEVDSAQVAWMSMEAWSKRL